MATIKTLKQYNRKNKGIKVMHQKTSNPKTAEREKRHDTDHK